MGFWSTLGSGLKAWTMDPFRVSGFGRYYEGAGAGRHGRLPVHVARSGPNAPIIADGAQLRDRSYALERNEPFVWRGINALCAMMIGTGVQPEPQVDDPVLRERIAELWDESADEMDADGRTDFYGLQVLALRSVFMGGDALARKRSRLKSDGFAVPFQVQLLEAAMLPLHWNTMNGQNVVRAGIELGPIGQRVAYWLYPVHPNDFMLTGLVNPMPVRVSADQVVHLHEINRPGQLRGEPRLARLIMSASEFHAGEEALQKAWNIAAAITGTIETTNPEFLPMQPAGTTPDADGKLDVRIEPGMWVPLRPGEVLNQAKPPEVGATYETATKLRLRRMAAGLGIPYETLSQDLEGVSYSSIRAGLVQVWSECDQFIWQTLVPQFCRPIWLAWFDAAVAAGALPIRTADYQADRRRFTRVAWNPPKRPWVDPLKDVQADILAVESGLKSRDEVVRSFGRNPAEVDQERKNSKDRAAVLGVTDEVAVGIRPPTSVDPGASPQAPTNETPVAPKRAGRQAA